MVGGCASPASSAPLAHKAHRGGAQIAANGRVWSFVFFWGASSNRNILACGSAPEAARRHLAVLGSTFELRWRQEPRRTNKVNKCNGASEFGCVLHWSRS